MSERSMVDRMRFQCPQCAAKYRIDAAKLPATGAKMRCKRCGSRFSVQDAPPAPCAGSGSASASPPQPTNRSEKPALQENFVDQFIAAGNPDGAARLLFEQIKQQAREKNFQRAEALRDKLYKVAPMALNEIVSANEVIEQEKSKAIDPDHMKLWSELYASLENDETSELYYAMRVVEVDAGRTVYEHGAHDANLYFVQSGSLKMYYYDEHRRENIVLKELFPGDIANADSFFSFTLCTCSLVATKDARLTYLPQRILDMWQELFPAIEPRLSGFCRRKLSVKNLIENAGVDLRAHPRYLISLKAAVQLLDDGGRPSGNRFRADLSDISAGGVSFGLQIHKRADAARLLGRRLVLKTAYRIGAETGHIQNSGRIVAAHLQPFGESSIHVRFDRLLPDSTVADIQALADREDQSSRQSKPDGPPAGELA